MQLLIKRFLCKDLRFMSTNSRSTYLVDVNLVVKLLFVCMKVKLSRQHGSTDRKQNNFNMYKTHIFY